MRPRLFIDAAAITDRIDGLGYYSLYLAERLVTTFGAIADIDVVISASASALAARSDALRGRAIIAPRERYGGDIYDDSYLHCWNEFVAARKPDVYLSTAFVPTTACCARAVVVHDVAPMAIPEVLRPEKVKVFSRLIQLAVMQSELVIVPSRFTALELERFAGPVRRTMIVPPDVHRMIARARSRPGLHTDHRSYVAIGVKCPRKSLSILLDAMTMLRARGVVAHLTLIGAERENETRLRDRIAANGLHDCVTITGYVTEDELLARLRRCHALLMPSLYEGFGMPLVEAIAAHKLVIARDSPLNREVAADLPLYVPPTAGAFADAMSSACAVNADRCDAHLSMLQQQSELRYAELAGWLLAALTAGRSHRTRRRAISSTRPHPA